MRFAWLFLGYLLMLSFPVGEISLLPVLGYALMLFAMVRLSHFEGVFKRAKYALYAALPIGALLLVCQIYLTVMGENTFKGFELGYEIIQWADELIEMLVMFFVYIGIKTIGEKAEYPSIEKAATRNMAIMFVYLAFEVVITVLRHVNFEMFDGSFSILLFYPFIIGLVWRALNLWMLIKCYVGIASTEEEERANRTKKKSKRPN